MSALRSKVEGLGLEWERPRGVAPKRMPKAEATTGLAPKKASATDSPLAAKPLPEGFGFKEQPLLSLVKFRRSGGLGLKNATEGRAAFARPSKWVLLPVQEAEVAVPIGRPFPESYG